MKKTCPDCEKEFEFIQSGRYKRKYCDKCSKERKKAWDNQWKLKIEDFDDDDN
jgi:predicted amidophosphoribosyltransferase